METSLVDPVLNELVDRVEAAMVSTFPQIECPSIHRFATGCYARESLAPAGTMLTSKIHKIQHFYVILEGQGKVWVNGEWKDYQAPLVGITEPGTRRIICADTDTRWITFHVTDSQDLGEIEEAIIEKHENPLLAEIQPLELQ